jgi:hypothetical protein
MLPNDVEIAMQMVYAYAPDITHWMTLKVQIMRHLKWETRTLFSRRHEVTKKPQTNNFDREVMKRWVEMTGQELDT